MNNPDALNVGTHEDEMTERDTVCGRCGDAFIATTPAPPDNCGRPEGESCPKCYTADRAWAIGRALEIDQPNIAAALAHDLLADLDPDDDRALVSICKGILADVCRVGDYSFIPLGGLSDLNIGEQHAAFAREEIEVRPSAGVLLATATAPNADLSVQGTGETVTNAIRAAVRGLLMALVTRE